MQITYSPVDRRAESLMQMAADRGLGVIVNRPFDGGDLLRRLAREPLPGLARELECLTWAALVLKWELAFPATTSDPNQGLDWRVWPRDPNGTDRRGL